MKIRTLFVVLMTLIFAQEISAAEKTTIVPDRLQLLPPGSIQLSGVVQERILQQEDLAFDEKTLAAMADVFRRRRSGFADGEFWGKTVRALCHHSQYSGDPRLRALLDTTLADLLTTQTPDGCISDYSPEKQPFNTDVWDRKYALLGLINGYETTGDPKVLAAATRMADQLLTQIGPATKIRVVDTAYITGLSPHSKQIPGGFQGIESSSILEPMLRLYRLTGKPAYLAFAKNIVEVEGGSKRGNIFEAAYAGGDAKDFGGDGDPDHAVAHAYSIISCFEGLAEYYRATGNEHWKQAALNFYTNVLSKEIVVIGACCGLGGVNNGPAPTEQFNYSAFFQTCPVRDGLEGCTHARWMAFCRHLLQLTGDSKFADQFERTMYNALLGSIRPDGQLVDYHTHLNGTRPAKINYHKVFNGRDITCCYYNVMDTLALIPTVAVMSDGNGPVVNLYLPGKARVKISGENEVALEQVTDYPRTGTIEILLHPNKPAHFPIRLRIPEWSEKSVVTVNGQPVEATPGTYLCLDRDWSAGDKISLTLDMRCHLVRPPAGGPKSGNNFQSLVRGPIVLARDKRLGGDIYEGVDIQADAQGCVLLTTQAVTIPALMQFSVPTVAGGNFPVVDFASSGNTWDAQSERVTWIPKPGKPAASWIWFPDTGNPAEKAPVGKRWFRRVLEIPAGSEIKQATATLCADNQFTFFINGEKVGNGDSWQKPVKMDLSSHLKPGSVVLAVEAVNTAYRGPNAAGLLGRFQIDLANDSSIILFTDGTWNASDQEMTGWQNSGFDDAGWKPAKKLGGNGMKPWGVIGGLEND